MKKVGKKLLMSIATCAAVLSISTSSVFAASTSNLSNSGAIIPQVTIIPGAPDGYTYVHGGHTVGLKRVGWQHMASNTVGDLADSVTYTVSRTKSTSFTGSATASFDVMCVKAGVSAEISIGSSTTTTWSATFSIPPHTTNIICEAGSLAASAYGTEYYVQDERLLSTRSVNGDWTYMSYTSKHY